MNVPPKQILLTDRPWRRRFWRSSWMVLAGTLVAMQTTEVPTHFGWERKTEIIHKEDTHKRKEVLAVTIYLTSGSSWVVPSDCVLISTLDCYGGGAAGRSGTSNTRLAGGGGGGFSRKSNIVTTPGASISYAVGAGGVGVQGADTSGGETWFSSTGLVRAFGGNVGSSITTGGLGASAGTGDLTRTGGAGGNGAGNSGGGGCGGPTSNGSASVSGVGGAGGGGLAGAGASQVTGTNDGAPGNAYGGGGGGASPASKLSREGGDGYQGIIQIDYTPYVPPSGINFRAYAY